LSSHGEDGSSPKCKGFIPRCVIGNVVTFIGCGEEEAGSVDLSIVQLLFFGPFHSNNRLSGGTCWTHAVAFSASIVNCISVLF
jgi:hypothetical protein